MQRCNLKHTENDQNICLDISRVSHKFYFQFKKRLSELIPFDNAMQYKPNH